MRQWHHFAAAATTFRTTALYSQRFADALLKSAVGDVLPADAPRAADAGFRVQGLGFGALLALGSVAL